jgi:hypothetical protein
MGVVMRVVRVLTSRFAVGSCVAIVGGVDDGVRWWLLSVLMVMLSRFALCDDLEMN